MSKKKKPEEHVNHERWVISYADFITLLFAFFTSMYAISTADAAKLGKMVFSMRSAFNMDFFESEKPVLGRSDPRPEDMQSPIVTLVQKPKKDDGDTTAGENFGAKQLRQLANDLERQMEAKGITGVKIAVNERGLIVSMSQTAFFAPGETQIRAASLPILDGIATKLLKAGYPVRIEGHSDDRGELANKKASNNWEVSTLRAVNVLRYLVEEFAFPADLLSAAGYASYMPVASNETPQGRALNRRVDLIVNLKRE